jgi:hypothetical protein
VVPELRHKFNSEFTPARYESLLESLEESVGDKIDFRLCETPVFIPCDLLQEMLEASRSIIAELGTPQYHTLSDRAIPPAFLAPAEGKHPSFIQIDFGVTRETKGRLVPRLIELQGCASLYAFQLVLPEEYGGHYDLAGLEYLFGGMSREDYLALFRKTVLGEHSPREVILMEIDPAHQKTRPDFVLTERLIGVPTVDITAITKRGRKLFFSREGKDVEIRRIYNRVIIDELVRAGVKAAFDFRDDLDVEWAGHPNWFFRMSKFSLPFLTHPTVPRSWLLDETGPYRDDLSQLVLKPLFSFAGAGVKLDVTQADLDLIPAQERSNYVLQEKVNYEPVVETPNEPSKAEIRIMFLWPDEDRDPTAVTTLLRLSKGAMMGVDFNKKKDWVGSSCGLFQQG